MHGILRCKLYKRPRAAQPEILTNPGIRGKQELALAASSGCAAPLVSRRAPERVNETPCGCDRVAPVAPIRPSLAIALAILTIGAPLLVGVAAWIIAGRTVPPLDGERRLPGLRAPVEVLFDSWGVPHVYARDSDDAWLVAGYLQARERLWKMELYRRAASDGCRRFSASGRCRPIAGSWRLGLRTAASVEWAQSTPPVRAALERHAAGVNAVIQQLTKYTTAGRIPAARHRSDAVDADRFAVDQQAHGVAAGRESARRVGARCAGAPVGLAGSRPAVGAVHVVGTDRARDR